MKRYAICLLMSFSILISMPLNAVSLWDNDFVWEYYDYYNDSMGNPINTIGRIGLLKYTLNIQDDDPSSLLWKFESSREWELRERDDKVGWGYEGENLHPKPDAEVVVDGDRVYMRITQEYVKKHGWCEFDYGAQRFIPATLEEDMEVTLYDFSVKPGDRYQTLLFGNFLTTANVVSTDFRDDILGGVRQVKILTDFSIQDFNLDYEPGEEFNENYDKFTISYVEKLGNISYGTFTELNPCWYAKTDGKHFETVINNVYDSQGEVVYKGKDFNGFASMRDITSDPKVSQTIYDLHGREVTNPVSGSIYIRNGKKFVAE